MTEFEAANQLANDTKIFYGKALDKYRKELNLNNKQSFEFMTSSLAMLLGGCLEPFHEDKQKVLELIVFGTHEVFKQFDNGLAQKVSIN